MKKTDPATGIETEQQDSANPLHLYQIYPDPHVIFAKKHKHPEEIKEQCLFVLDTNVLLLPYGVTSSSIQEIRKILGRLIREDRLVIPAHVAREFASNRGDRIKNLYSQVKVKQGTSFTKSPNPLLNSISSYKEALELEKSIEENLKKYKEKLSETLRSIERWQWRDPITELYQDLFTEKVIFNPPIKHEDLLKEHSLRVQNKIPPGYKDAGKGQNSIGDFAIWDAILKVGAETKKDLLLVTGEEKPDWVSKSHSISLAPRYELVYEYAKQSGGAAFGLVKYSEFLGLFDAQEKAIEEIQQQEQLLLVHEVSGRATFGESAYEFAERAVLEWFVKQYPAAIIRRERHYSVDFVLEMHGRRIGVDVKLIKYSHNVRNRIYDTVGRFSLTKPPIDKLIVAVVLPSEDAYAKAKAALAGLVGPILPGVTVLSGYMSSEDEFVPQQNPEP